VAAALGRFTNGSCSGFWLLETNLTEKVQKDGVLAIQNKINILNKKTFSGTNCNIPKQLYTANSIKFLPTKKGK
jgi:hypothetical protein